MSMQVNGAGAINAATIQSLDLETALMAVQSNRAEMLETQLKDQIASVQAKNDQIAKLNTLMGYVNSLAAKFDSGASATATLAKKIPSDEYSKLNSHLEAAGVTRAAIFGETTALVDMPKSSFDGAIAKLKSSIDSLSNTQQMDMLRLQSLSNKRNEAFDIMTNFIKKMQDNRSSIIGNMR